MSNYRITIAVPCFGRPQRTRRIIKNILDQDINNWEAFVIGDGCDHFNELLASEEKNEFIKIAEEKGNKLHMFNLEKNYGGWGYEIMNYAMRNASGKFLIFAGNDDKISSDHFSHYLSEIENTDLDLVFYDTYIEPQKKARYPSLKLGDIGHAEIIFRTSILDGVTQPPIYAADWEIISQVLKKTNKYKKADSTKITYTITKIDRFCSDIID